MSFRAGFGALSAGIWTNTGGGQSILDNTLTDLQLFHFADNDPFNMLAADGDTFLTFRRTGLILLNCGIDWAANATGYRFMTHNYNDGLFGYGQFEPVGSAAVINSYSFAEYFQATADTTIRIRVRHTAGAALNANDYVVRMVYLT